MSSASARGRDKNGNWILAIEPGAGVPENAVDRANLYAAAPDLLASCQELVAGLLSTASLGLSDAEVARLKRAEAAIAKAKGEQASVQA